MIPVLYPATRTIFTGNGLGLLYDVKSCKCTEKLNEQYELEIVMPRTGQYANLIEVGCCIKAKPNYSDNPQLFRVYSVEKSYDDMITVHAAHISYDTVGIPILPFTADTLQSAVDNMNTNRKLLDDSIPFVLNAEFSKEGTMTVDSPTSFRSLLGGSENSIREIYGGDYHYDNYVINLVEKRGISRGIVFRYGKNIIDFDHEVNSEELYTAVLGYWKKSGSSGTIIYGNIIQCEGVFPYDKIYILDTTNDIKNANNADATVDQIDECVEKYIADNAIGIPKTNMKIDYTDDDSIIRVCVGDRVGIIFPEYDIYTTARCNTVVFNSLTEKNESIEVGVDPKELADTIAELI